MYALTLLTLAAAAVAAPTKNIVARQSDSFGLVLSTASANYTLLAAEVSSDSNSYYILYGDSCDPYEGTPATYNATSENQGTLALTYNAEQLYLSVFNEFVGSGWASEVTAGAVSAANADNGFTAGDGFVEHSLKSADQTWLACNKTVDGAIRPVLSFGAQYLNGSYVEGCTFASLRQKFQTQ